MELKDGDGLGEIRGYRVRLGRCGEIIAGNWIGALLTLLVVPSVVGFQGREFQGKEHSVTR